MKKDKIIFWTTTAIIAVLVGFTPIFTWNDPKGLEMMNHLGYPAYFTPMLNIFKILGGIALLVPQIPSKIKEWAYAGFGFDFIAATVSLIAVDGAIGQSFIPLAFLAILAVSYIYRGKLAK
jgi:DoxX-like family